LEGEESKVNRRAAEARGQWKTIAAEIAETRKEFGTGSALGKRRTEIGEPPAAILVPVEALVEREPVTVLCSEKGWIRTVKGHNGAAGEAKYKEGDGPRFVVTAETTDRLVVFGTNGRFYTLPVDRLP